MVFSCLVPDVWNLIFNLVTILVLLPPAPCPFICTPHNSPFWDLCTLASDLPRTAVAALKFIRDPGVPAYLCFALSLEYSEADLRRIPRPERTRLYEKFCNAPVKLCGSFRALVSARLTWWLCHRHLTPSAPPTFPLRIWLVAAPPRFSLHALPSAQPPAPVSAPLPGPRRRSALIPASLCLPWPIHSFSLPYLGPRCLASPASSCAVSQPSQPISTPATHPLSASALPMPILPALPSAPPPALVSALPCPALASAPSSRPLPAHLSSLPTSHGFSLSPHRFSHLPCSRTRPGSQLSHPTPPLPLACPASQPSLPAPSQSQPCPAAAVPALPLAHPRPRISLLPSSQPSLASLAAAPSSWPLPAYLLS